MNQQKIEYIRCVDDLLESIEFTGISREEFIFRGQVKDWNITSSIMRDKNDNSLEYNKCVEIQTASFKSLIEGKKIHLL